LSNVNPVPADNGNILRIIQACKAAEAAGRNGEADQLLTRAAQLAPAHPAVLNELGMRMMQRNEPAKARELFQRATQADPGHPALWANLAASLAALGLQQEQLEAIERALAIEPRHLSSLLQKGALIEDQGDSRNAARAYRNALATMPSGATPAPAISGMVDRARAAVRTDDEALAGALEARLAAIRDQHAGADFKRVDRCVEILTSRRARFNSEPTFMFFPQIPAIEFFERGDFPWLDAIEAATDDIRTELTAVLVADRAGLEPYIAYPDGVPLDRWRELNKSRRWSAYFLSNQGVELPAHIARCPRTMQALKGAPLCDVAARGPTVFFSILDASTHIPPHTGLQRRPRQQLGSSTVHSVLTSNPTTRPGTSGEDHRIGTGNLPGQLGNTHLLKITDDGISPDSGKIGGLLDLTDQPNRHITALAQQPRKPQRDLPMPTSNDHPHRNKP